MADLITLKGGNGEVPKLQDREPAIRKDEKALYVGINGKNEKVGDKAWEDRIKALESQINILNVELDTLKQQYATTEYVNGLIANISTRLGDLERAVENINTRLDAMATPDE